MPRNENEDSIGTEKSLLRFRKGEDENVRLPLRFAKSGIILFMIHRRFFCQQREQFGLDPGFDTGNLSFSLADTSLNVTMEVIRDATPPLFSFPSFSLPWKPISLLFFFSFFFFLFTTLLLRYHYSDFGNKKIIIAVVRNRFRGERSKRGRGAKEFNRT